MRTIHYLAGMMVLISANVFAQTPVAGSDLDVCVAPAWAREVVIGEQSAKRAALERLVHRQFTHGSRRFRAQVRELNDALLLLTRTEFQRPDQVDELRAARRRLTRAEFAIRYSVPNYVITLEDGRGRTGLLCFTSRGEVPLRACTRLEGWIGEPGVELNFPGFTRGTDPCALEALGERRGSPAPAASSSGHTEVRESVEPVASEVSRLESGSGAASY